MRTKKQRFKKKLQEYYYNLIKGGGYNEKTGNSQTPQIQETRENQDNYMRDLLYYAYN